MTQTFDAYAQYYDLVYGDKDYGSEAVYVAGLIRQHSQHTERVLELGCGTGGHAEHLARIGLHVHGVDLSEEMIRRAELRRASLDGGLAARVSFERADIREVRVPLPFDAVISLFHVMSYQTGNEDFNQALSTAAAHLRQGGLFVFDFWYGPAVLTCLPAVRVKRLANDRVSLIRIAEPELHPNQNVVDVNYTVLVTELKRGVTETIKETHRMRYFFSPELHWMLQQHGFEVVEEAAWMTKAAMDLESWAGVFVARKR